MINIGNKLKFFGIFFVIAFSVFHFSNIALADINTPIANMPITDGDVLAIAYDPAGAGGDGIVYIGGTFHHVMAFGIDAATSNVKNHLAAFNATTGAIIDSFAPSIDDTVRALALNTDGSNLYIGGDFRVIGVTVVHRLAKLSTTDGSVDASFNANADVNNSVNSLLLNNDDSHLYVGGSFTTLNNGTDTRNLLGAVDISDGSTFSNFNPNVSGSSVESLAFSSDKNTIYVGGKFSKFNGATNRNNLAALDSATGSLGYGTVTSFNPNVNNTVHTIKLSSDNSTLYFGGEFTNVGGLPSGGRNYLASVNTGSTNLNSFDPSPDNYVFSLDLGSNDTILYVGGDFLNISASSRAHVASVNVSDDTLNSFDPNPSAASSVYSVFSTSSSILYIGGSFPTINGEARQGFAGFNLNENPFITTWKTSNSGISNSKTITIPVVPVLLYNFSIDWGDGNIETLNNLDIVNNGFSHTYLAGGTYAVSISGTFPRIYFNDGVDTDAKKIISIDQWGANIWSSMENAFSGCSNLVIAASDDPDLSSVTDMSYMFLDASAVNAKINSSWNTSNVTDMSGLFSGATSFDQNISGWDMRNVITTTQMFKNATSFNQDLSLWDVSSVTKMASMFEGATSFNNGGLPLEWADDTANVNNMSLMFAGTTAFDADISGWKVSSVTTFSNMFSYATIFNQPLNTWNINNAENVSMRAMFYHASSFNQDLSSWNTSLVSDMSSMFAGASYFNKNISSWDVSSVLEMNSMFSDANNFDNKGNALSWDANTLHVANMANMFYHTSFNQDITNWDTSAVTNMSHMFDGDVSFNQDIGGWDVGNVQDFSLMFYGNTSFNQDLSSWNVISANTMNGMFYGASMFNQPLNAWGPKLGLVTDMSYMFSDATLFNQNLDTWVTSIVTNMDTMFGNATAFDQDISNWDVSSVANMSGMFTNDTLSIANYDALLADWSAESLQDNVTLDAGNSKYCSATNARGILTNAPNSWTITDGGYDNSCVPVLVITTNHTTTGSYLPGYGPRASINNIPVLGAPGKCAPELIITQNLKAGSRNGKYNSYTRGIVKEVKILQMHMNRLGFKSGPNDGILGPITDGAIKRMQKYLGTKADGLIGPITRGLINNSCGKN
ncbi:MAG: BspA family leucine-rich repeat surface protein [Candidatus Nomurabacteria bacterium]|nr:BspA family leucine-rich repeat surface protein [Candidatus Nomurabacteria bacterium]